MGGAQAFAHVRVPAQRGPSDDTHVDLRRTGRKEGAGTGIGRGSGGEHVVDQDDPPIADPIRPADHEGSGEVSPPRAGIEPYLGRSSAASAEGVGFERKGEARGQRGGETQGMVVTADAKSHGVRRNRDQRSPGIEAMPLGDQGRQGASHVPPPVVLKRVHRPHHRIETRGIHPINCEGEGGSERGRVAGAIGTGCMSVAERKAAAATPRVEGHAQEDPLAGRAQGVRTPDR